MNMSKRMLKKLASGGAAVSAMVAGSAHAALDTAVTTQVATTSGDITEAGTLIIGLAVVAMGVRWVKATFF